jgi:uncharacterized protein (TIGR00251 family)
MPSLFLDFTVTPSTGMQKITVDKHGKLKILLKNPPEDGKANKELVRLLSDKTGITQNSITIVRGLTTRKKRVAFATELSFALLLEKLGIDYQTMLH